MSSLRRQFFYNPFLRSNRQLDTKILAYLSRRGFILFPRPGVRVESSIN